MLRRGPVLGRSAASAPMMTPMMMAPTQVSLLGMVQYAGFAKYQRNKPHLNVGTIGRFYLLLFQRATISFQSSKSETRKLGYHAATLFERFTLVSPKLAQSSDDRDLEIAHLPF